MRASWKLVGAALSVAALVITPSAHAAISMTVTGDDGQPTALNPASPLGLRNVHIVLDAKADAGEGGYWSLQTVDPSGAPASYGHTCYLTTTEDQDPISYHGNGIYTAILRFYGNNDSSCAGTAREVRYAWSVNAFVQLGQPAAAELTRQPGSFADNTHLLAIAGNPGASGYEIRYAKNATIAPDGSIAGTSQTGYLDETTGKAKLSLFDGPGVYTVVARGYYGENYTAWSVPVTLRLVAPFDFSTHDIPDSIGPSYKVRATLGEKTATGKVTIAIAPGKKGKHFRRLGTAKISSKHTISLRFTIRKRGWYTIRYHYAGSATTVGGSIYQVVHIKRILG